MRDPTRVTHFCSILGEFMSTQAIDLGSLFGAVATTLAENRDPINSSDAYNGNHGDNMAENFRLITRAVNRKKGASPSEQLNYASQVLSKNAQTGSARMYSQGLARAADQLRGQPAVTQENAMGLIQALLGGGGSPAAQSSSADQGDALGGLLGSILSGGQAPVQSDAQNTPADPFGGLLGGLFGGGQPAPQTSQQDDVLGGLFSSLLGEDSTGQTQAHTAPAASQPGGLDMNTLLTAGMAFLQARQQGATPVQALVNAVMAGSQMNSTPHHSQSGQLVASTLINTVASLLSKK
jgi:hypothetical protein